MSRCKDAQLYFHYSVLLFLGWLAYCGVSLLANASSSTVVSNETEHTDYPWIPCITNFESDGLKERYLA